jgi:hypothetical protein
MSTHDQWSDVSQIRLSTHLTPPPNSEADLPITASVKPILFAMGSWLILLIQVTNICIQAWWVFLTWLRSWFIINTAAQQTPRWISISVGASQLADTQQPDFWFMVRHILQVQWTTHHDLAFSSIHLSSNQFPLMQHLLRFFSVVWQRAIVVNQLSTLTRPWYSLASVLLGAILALSATMTRAQSSQLVQFQTPTILSSCNNDTIKVILTNTNGAKDVVYAGPTSVKVTIPGGPPVYREDKVTAGYSDDSHRAG